MERGTYIGTYRGKEMLGFLFNHKYEFELSNDKRTYKLYAYRDITDEKCKTVDLHIHYASETSINRNWEIK